MCDIWRRRNLKLEYVDMYLIHWPVRLTEMVRKTPVPVEIVKPLDIKGAWKGMEECLNLGLTKAIGVSNFSIKTLDQLLSTAKIPPTLNQVASISLILHLIFHIYLKNIL